MRSLLLAACVLSMAGPASAQDDEPRPFVSAEPMFRSTNRELTGVGNTAGVDVKVGLRPWRGIVQPLFQGGRLIDVTPALLIRHSFEPPFARQTSTWYGTAGLRVMPPNVWRFQPYAEAGGGVAHMNSEVETGANPFHVKQVVPVSTAGIGVDFRIGRHFTIDAGYQLHNFFGVASVQRRGPRLGFGVRF
jgi:opacity protein-like surface antigen